MQKKYKISIAALTVLALGVLTANLVLGTVPSLDIRRETEGPSFDDAELARLRQLAPTTFEAADGEIRPVRHRFLLWTRDGAHIMWGRYGNGRFVGTDNLRKRCWGIYGKGVFAGFYDGDFFWGHYHNGTWKARYLFGLNASHGRYILFPHIPAVDAAP
jgi:hypothetical protein